MQIKRRIFLAIIYLSCFSALTPAQSEQLPQPISQLVDQLSSAHTFSLAFRQQIHNAVSGQTIKKKGTVVISIPDKFRWNYTSTPPNIFASDGVTLRVILPQDRQMMLAERSNVPFDLSPVSVFTNKSEISQTYHIKTVSVQNDIAEFRLTPRKSNDQFKDLRLLIPTGKDSPYIFSLVILDMAGNKNQLYFSNMVKVSEPVDFSPAAPAGYIVTDFSGKPILDHGKVSNSNGR